MKAVNLRVGTASAIGRIGGVSKRTRSYSFFISASISAALGECRNSAGFCGIAPLVSTSLTAAVAASRTRLAEL